MKQVIGFDIETGPQPEADLLAAMPEFEAPGNLKDPVKIAAAIEEKRAKWFDRAALDASTGVVLAIGVGKLGEWVEVIHGDEAEMLARFWKYAADVVNSEGVLCGWYSSRFDLPFLLRRSWILGVPNPGWLRAGRYWDRSLVDLAEIWSLGDREQIVSLDVAARALGVGRKSGNGADFAKLFLGTPEQRAEALQYLENDIRLTLGVAERLGVAEGRAA